MPRGSNLAGKPGPGRPKGLQNKTTSDLKGMILVALSRVGGSTWLEKIAMEQPEHFVKLLSMLVPREVSHSGSGSGVQVNIVSNVLGINALEKEQLCSTSTAGLLEGNMEGNMQEQDAEDHD